MKRFLRILFILFCVLYFHNAGYAQSNFSVTVSKVNYTYKHPSKPDGLFTIGFTPGAQRAYLSIGATNNSTQQFDIIVSNMLLPSISDMGGVSGTVMRSTRFDFSKISVPPYLTNMILTIYIHILSSVGFYPFDPSTFKDQKTVTVNQVVDNAKGAQRTGETTIPIIAVVRPGQTLNDPLKAWYYRPDAPNLDLDSSQHGATASYAGDINACVPTATANSMKWAQSKYSDINLPADMDLRKTETTLSGLMKRDSGKGTPTKNMLSGKLDFIEQFKLPMEVKYEAFLDSNSVGVGSTSGKSIARNFNAKTSKKQPTWDFLKKMLQDGEDVEVNYMWYDTTAKAWFAHSVNVTGFAEYNSGYKWFEFKHDVKQEGAGGLVEEGHQITVDGNGWMRFGVNNENFIQDVVAESPVIQEGRETAAWLNELFTDAPLRKGSSGAVVPRFVEVALKSTVTDLSNYTITLYDGKTGASYATYTLNQFTAGTTTNGLKVYSMNIPGLLGSPAGVAVSHTGAVIQNQFVSYGGSFVAADGDATGLTSINIGDIPTASSVQMSGSGTSFAQMGVTYGVPTPGDINQDQTYSTPGLLKPNSISPNNGERNKTGPVPMTWNKVAGASNYEVQVSGDPFFLTDVVLTNSTLTDTAYSFANSNLDGRRLYWRIRASGSNMKSGFSAARNFSNKLNSPTNLSASLVQSKATLTWQNNSTRAKGFYIQRKAGDANSTNQFQTIDSMSTNSYTDGSAQAGATYTYRVYAYNDVAESDFSNTQTLLMVTGLQPPALFGPVDSAKNLPQSLSLSWVAASGATSYHVQLSNRADLTSPIVDDSSLTTTSRAIGPLSLGTTYYWRVRAKYSSGYSPFSQARQFSTSSTTSAERMDGGIPTEYALGQNYPNPFNPSTKITFALPKTSHVTLTIVDALGRVQAVLINGERTAGRYIVEWNAANVPSGIYFYRLQAGDASAGSGAGIVETKKMILIR
jgi:hypothetical protein